MAYFKQVSYFTIANFMVNFIQENVNIRIARIFNTFGPRMHMNDGRVVSNFIIQALKGESIKVIFSLSF